MRSTFVYFALAAMSILAASCSKTPLPGPQPHPVHGKVVYRGQPAKGFRVIFYPLGEQGKRKFAPLPTTVGSSGCALIIQMTVRRLASMP
jgi:hypothetical protein